MGESLYDTISSEVEKLIAAFKEKLSDGKLSLTEMWYLFNEFVGSVVVICEELGDDGPEKREAAIEAVMALWKNVVKPIDMPWLPDSVVDPIVENVLPLLVGVLIDWTVDTFNAKFWPERVK